MNNVGYDIEKTNARMAEKLKQMQEQESTPGGMLGAALGQAGNQANDLRYAPPSLQEIVAKRCDSAREQSRHLADLHELTDLMVKHAEVVRMLDLMRKLSIF